MKATAKMRPTPKQKPFTIDSPNSFMRFSPSFKFVTDGAAEVLRYCLDPIIELLYSLYLSFSEPFLGVPLFPNAFNEVVSPALKV